MDELNIKAFSEGVSSVDPISPANGDTIKVGDKAFYRGVRAPSTSVMSFSLEGYALHFTANLGLLNNPAKKSPVKFFVLGDRKILFESKAMNSVDTVQHIDVDLAGIKRLGLLVVGDKLEHNGTTGFWGDAAFTMKDQESPLPIPNDDEKYILTPFPGKAPKINTSKIFGARPGRPFLFSITASGKQPRTYAADQLPSGLVLDKNTGIITGKITKSGNYLTTLRVKNAFGEDTAGLVIKIGDTIALTPPMGWNGWNSWARDIDREKVISSADAMIKLGLHDFGWTYINIDDAWQGQRGGKYNAIQPNEKFPDFKGMIHDIHSLGLKAGIYSTPWIASYAGYTGGSSDYENGIFPDSIRDNKRAYRHIGQYRFENNDAQQMADWGIDYLKYDWRLELPSAIRMSESLKNSGRDILYSLSNSASFEFAKDWARISNMWRTGPDIRDSWTSLYISAFTIDKWAPFGGPGHWNDPDMLIVGNVSTGMALHPTRLTPDEQYSHVSIYCLLAAPLMIGCPIEQLDPFTLNLLTNAEIIAVDQDPLGQPGRLVLEENGIQVWRRTLQDGSFAVGLFNTDDFGKTPQSFFRWGDEKPKEYELDFSALGLQGKWDTRDLWRQKDLGVFSGSFKTEIPHHGVVMLRLFPEIN